MRAALLMAALVLATAAPAAAHVTRHAGPYTLRIGWLDEPAFSGSQNGVEVEVTDAAGDVRGLRGDELTVEISSGVNHVVLPLLPAAESRGRLVASIVPTRPGTYTFRIRGTLNKQRVDAAVTCSQRTFDCVTDPSAVEFPAKDPSAGELAQRLERSLPRAERARSTASTARTLAVVAVALAALALAVAVGFGVRSRKGG